MVTIEPCNRFMWERILRRCLIPGPTKFVGCILAQFADHDGSNVRPGTPVIAATCGMAERTAERHLAALRGLGLIDKVANGGGRNARAARYQLTIPSDLIDRVDMLGTDERTPATQVAGVQRTPATQMAGVQWREY